jgi:hypothetical protein
VVRARLAPLKKSPQTRAFLQRVKKGPPNLPAVVKLWSKA